MRRDSRAHTRLVPIDDGSSALADLSYSDSNLARAEEFCTLAGHAISDESERQNPRTIDTADFSLQDQANEARSEMQALHAKLRTHPSRQLAEKYSKARETYESLAQKLREARNTATIYIGGVQQNFVQVTLPCDTPMVPDFPNRPLFAASGSAVGLLLGIVLIVVEKSRAASPI
jgi:uncharacterized protein involved in exopolysaccharide biosynthesis